MQSCAFTGHRTLEKSVTRERVQEEIERLVKGGIHTFYCGLALGFDMLAGEVVLSLKNKYPQIRLIGCVPCEGQDKYYPPKEKARYAVLKERCDEVVVVCESYSKWCFFKRNDYMCEKADTALAYLTKTTGGTAYTVRAFQRAGKPVVFLP